MHAFVSQFYNMYRLLFLCFICRQYIWLILIVDFRDKFEIFLQQIRKETMSFRILGKKQNKNEMFVWMRTYKQEM